MKPSIKIRSLLMGLMISPRRRRSARRRRALARWLSGKPPTIHYFHQVDDPYSHMAVQRLDALKARYPRCQFRIHLVTSPLPEYQGDAERFGLWALHDARSVAPFYGVSLPDAVAAPAPGQAQNLAGQLVPQLWSPGFAGLAAALGKKLWQGETIAPGAVEPSEAWQQGNATRARLGHYLSATFYFEGEWYWGLDRLCHLEARLVEQGLSAEPGAPLCVPRPEAEPATGKDASQVTLEYFPSLRSPYTAISYARTFDLVERTGVKLELKPVMPMMMRGIPAPRPKQLYIMKDAKREAEAAAVPFGNFVDPFGEPVKRAFSLLPYLRSIGKDAAFVASYLQATWQEGIDITVDAGLKEVVERAGASWQEASAHLGSPEYEALLEANIQELLEAGFWGVPSYRVSGGNNPEPFQCWGQDRLWRVETDIWRRID